MGSSFVTIIKRLGKLQKDKVFFIQASRRQVENYFIVLPGYLTAEFNEFFISVCFSVFKGRIGKDKIQAGKDIYPVGIKIVSISGPGAAPASVMSKRVAMSERGSRSINPVFSPLRAKYTARLTHVVVLPTPPLLMQLLMIWL